MGSISIGICSDIHIDLFIDRSEDWKLIGYWPKILQKYIVKGCIKRY